ncbi:MAG: Flagellin [bacterium ADurb.Bin243]|nr:MAG: Flagellin [bacterium ADurb.Bin243]
MYLNTNIAAINAQRNLYQTNLSMDKTLERLSSGLRINSSADDASGLAIVEKMYAQRQGLTTAIQNTQDGIALFKIAEGALNQVGKMLSRMEELAVRASNQTLTSSDRSTIKSEIDQLVGQINTISKDTEYNTLKLLNGNLDVQSTTQAASIRSSGSIKVLAAPGTVQDVSNLSFVLLSAGTAATIAAVTSAQAGTAIGIANTTMTVNGVEIGVSTSDTVETIVSKINLQNSRTGVIATTSKSSTGLIVSLVSGKIDADAANVTKAGSFTTAQTNGNAIGYLAVGSINTVTGQSNKIEVGGSELAWSFLTGGGTTTGLNGQGTATGTNAIATLGGIALTVKASEGGTVFEMTNSGSKAYGVKIGVELFNGAQGGLVLDNVTSATWGVTGMASATAYVSGRLAVASTVTASGDTAMISFSAANKLNLQTGANYQQNLEYTIGSIDAASIGRGASSKFGSLADISVDTASNAALSLKVVQQAIKDVSSVRATMGAVMNRLDYTDKTLQIQRENITAAESRIRDADVSLEMTAFVRQQILMQAGTSMLAQANQKPQSIMQLLQ